MSERPVLVWVDLETTGLDPQKDEILEIAAVPTDTDLVTLDQSGPIFHALVEYDSVGKDLDPVVREMHTTNGLFSEIRPWAVRPGGRAFGKTKLGNIGWVDSMFDQWLRSLKDWSGGRDLVQAGACPHFDRAFMVEHLNAEVVFDYHLFDISTMLRAARWWRDEEHDQADSVHRTLPDVWRAIDLARRLRAGYVPNVAWGRGVND